MGFYRHLAMTLPSQSQFDSALTKTDLAEIFKCRGDPHHWGFVAYQIGPRGCCGTSARSNGTTSFSTASMSSIAPGSVSNRSLCCIFTAIWSVPQVERVIDGDTIRVRYQGKTFTVRLIGVDTPETKHPTKAVQHFGREASAFTKAHLEGKLVALVKDRTGDTVDRYGRLLRHVLLDGDNFNARLIREGYAHAYRLFPFSKRTEFIQLEEQARRRWIGLWNRR